MALQLRKSKISWTRLSPLMLSWPSMSFRAKNLPEYVELYHPYDWADFTKLAPELPLDNIFTEILGQVPDKVIVLQERFWTEFAAEYYSEANWELLKGEFYLLMLLQSWNAYLTDELRVLWLENMVVRFQEHHKPWKRKRLPSIWHKALTIKL